MQHRYNPWHHAHLLGVRVQHEALPGGRWGEYRRDERLVVLDADLCQAERRCTLAHELVHAERDDVCGLTDWHDHRQERAVRDVAARRLIPLEALAAALVTCHPDDLRHAADELWVDEDVLVDRLEYLEPGERGYLRSRLRAAEREIA